MGEDTEFRAGQFRAKPRERFFVARGEYKIAAFGSERAGDGKSDAARGARDQGDTTFQGRGFGNAGHGFVEDILRHWMGTRIAGARRLRDSRRDGGATRLRSDADGSATGIQSESLLRCGSSLASNWLLRRNVAFRRRASSCRGGGLR